MGNNLNFNSSVCTTREQSKRLLELGLKPETADCQHFAYTTDSKGKPIPKRNQKWVTRIGIDKYVPVCGFMSATFIPAWSLHRLIELLPQDIHLDDYANTRYYLTINPIKVVYVNSHRSWIYQRNGGCLYDKLIDTIEWTIKKISLIKNT